MWQLEAQRGNFPSLHSYQVAESKFEGSCSNSTLLNIVMTKNNVIFLVFYQLKWVFCLLKPKVSFRISSTNDPCS